MINFKDLTAPAEHRPITTSARYVVSCDPEDNEGLEEGLSIFTIYDKVLQRVTTSCRTKKSIHQFYESLVNIRGEFKSNYILSEKFVNPNGTAKRISEVRLQA